MKKYSIILLIVILNSCDEEPVFISEFNCGVESFSNLEKIEDVRLRQLYEDIIYFYSGLIQSIETVGEEKKFYYKIVAYITIIHFLTDRLPASHVQIDGKL